MFEWLIFLFLTIPFSDSPEVEPNLEKANVVVAEETSAPDGILDSDESMAAPQCCGPNPLPPPGGGQ